jgi:hypothetical protein
MFEALMESVKTLAMVGQGVQVSAISRLEVSLWDNPIPLAFAKQPHGFGTILIAAHQTDGRPGQPLVQRLQQGSDRIVPGIQINDHTVWSGSTRFIEKLLKPAKRPYSVYIVHTILPT